MNSQDVIEFWFEEVNPNQWFKKDPELDHLIRMRFEALHAQAARGELSGWRATPQGRLAEIIVLDQFPRNMYRNTPQAFATDHMALKLAQEAIKAGSDEEMPAPQKTFLYMPFMHSESRLDHEVAIKLFSAHGLENNLKIELKHKTIIDRFGRFPHRNKILSRLSSRQELDFLKEPNSSF